MAAVNEAKLLELMKLVWKKKNEGKDGDKPEQQIKVCDKIAGLLKNNLSKSKCKAR